MPMIRYEAFPTPIFHEELHGIDNRAIEKYAYELREKDTAGIGKIPEDGWQSNYITSGTKEYDILLYEIIDKMAEVCRNLQIPDVQLFNNWININQPNTYINQHCHEGATFSGVYYIKTPKNCGNLKFRRPDEGRYYLPMMSQENDFLAEHWEVNAVERLMLIFPAWMPHHVLLNKSNEDRISMSFNFGVRLAN